MGHLTTGIKDYVGVTVDSLIVLDDGVGDVHCTNTV